MGKINPNAVFVLGDVQYNGATIDKYKHFYDLSWGKFKNITYPSLGNHDYEDPGASGYFEYFGKRAGEKGKGYYSFSLGSWHIIALNSNCAQAGGCQKSSEQEKWLEQDLSSNRTKCTLAFFHHPLFTTGQHEPSTFVNDFWDDLYANHADIILNGHDHVYERFVPQNPKGEKVSNGIREFVVGTGGRSLYSFNSTSANLESRQNSQYGVLKLTLNPSSYSWQFISIDGKTMDSGSSSCN